MKFIFALITLLALQGCSSKKVASDDVTSGGAQLFSLPGTCSQGVLSPNGKRGAALCTISDQKESPQIYEFDFDKKSFRQVTWQDGKIGSVDWLNDDRLVYDSNTDELKEAPFFGLTPDKIGSEIYVSDRYGTEIDRWTERMGEDGNVAATKVDNRLLFVSRRGSSLVVFIRDQQGSFRPVSPLTPSTKFSPALIGRQAAWLEMDEGGKTVSLRLQGRATPERWLSKDLRSLRSIRDGWLLTEVNENKTGSSVWFLKADFSCEKPVLLGQEVLVFADASLSPAQLFLTVQDKNLQRLTLRGVASDSFTCSEDRVPAKVNP
ncbi:MAG: hypothetical protein KF789_07690 [Bdellovibrionaceae bacterium]|nr:hypothetical protein [Pseudobdellovibrionaceae bacterium]